MTSDSLLLDGVEELLERAEVVDFGETVLLGQILPNAEVLDASGAVDLRNTQSLRPGIGFDQLGRDLLFEVRPLVDLPGQVRPGRRSAAELGHVEPQGPAAPYRTGRRR